MYCCILYILKMYIFFLLCRFKDIFFVKDKHVKVLTIIFIINLHHNFTFYEVYAALILFFSPVAVHN